MSYPDADILEITPGGLKKTVYEATEHDIVTRDFFGNTSKMQQILME